MVYIYKPRDINIWIPIKQADDYILQVGDIVSVSHLGLKRYNPPLRFRVVAIAEEEQCGQPGVRIQGVEDGQQVQIRPLSTCDTVQHDEADALVSEGKAANVMRIFEQKSKAH